jgi:5-methylcytosine-specific restriction protein B
MAVYTWIPIYKELAVALLEYENRQGELLDVIRKIAASGIPMIPIQDKPSLNESSELEEIDPFTFYSNFNRGITDENRKQILTELKKIFKLKSDIPSDFSGIPVMTNQKSWLFAFKYERGSNDIKLLWQLFKEAVTSDIKEETFDQVLKIKGVKINITIGLFWVMPDKYLSLDGVLKEYTGLDFDKLNYKKYFEIMNLCKQKYKGKGFQEISFDAWNLKKSEIDSSISKRLNAIIPDKNLQIKILKCFAESIIKANESDPAGWNVKLQTDRFYLNTGQPWCICIQKNKPSELVLDKPSLDKNTMDKIIKYEKDWDVPSVPPKENNYSLDLEISDVPDVYEITRQAHFRFIERAAKPHKARENHDADFVEYIGKILDITLPIPSYNKKDHIEADMNNDIFVNSKLSLNTILYGPPGTGKTYRVIDYALKIIDGAVPPVRQEAVVKFNEYMKTGRIDFATFHQSFSYEEFVEGISPDLDRNKVIEGDVNDSDQISYILKSGIFKRISSNAGKFTIFNESTVNSFEKIIDDFTSRFEEVELIDGLKTQTGETFSVKISNNGDSFYCKPDKGRNWYTVSKDNIRSRYYNPDFNVTNMTYINGIVLYLKSAYKLSEPVKEDDTGKSDKPFILIIDEINRGNISKIFGELITLIEDDKRLGAENEITVTLPYSKEKFGVPSNLYIIGTMNTADRSIALMDTALRRRFTFVEMMPELSTLDGLLINGIDIKEMLTKINERIEFLHDRDHTIGHAYFINLKNISDSEEQYASLCGIFSTKIIPLLQEYFYDDWEKIQLVLGDHIKQITGSDKDSLNFDDELNKKRFVQSRLFKEKDILGFDHENYEDRITYRINPDLNNADINPEAFIKIYNRKIDA